jgi:hypothetical protein
MTHYYVIIYIVTPRVSPVTPLSLSHPLSPVCERRGALSLSLSQSRVALSLSLSRRARGAPPTLSLSQSRAAPSRVEHGGRRQEVPARSRWPRGGLTRAVLAATGGRPHQVWWAGGNLPHADLARPRRISWAALRLWSDLLGGSISSSSSGGSGISSLGGIAGPPPLRQPRHWEAGSGAHGGGGL